MNCGNSEEELKLAKEYKYLLSNIRPLIEQLDKSKDAQLCLLWLSKLDQCSRYEKLERNEILSELSRQVKNKCLEPPFNSQPPPGSLKNVMLHNSIPLWRANDFSDDLTSETSETKSPLSSFSVQSRFESEKCHPRFTPRKGKLQCRTKLTTIKELHDDHSQCLAIQKKYHDRVLNDQMLIKRYQEIIKSLITQKFRNLEASSKRIKSMKSNYESRISDLTSSLKAVEDENCDLKQKLANSSVPQEKLHEYEMRNAELKEKLGHLEIRSNILELKCRDLERDKIMALNDLGNKLSESERKLKEGENNLRAAEKKFEENFRALNAEHQNEICELEKKYTCDLSSLERILEEKQNEISSLREQVSAQCVRFEEEVMRLKHELLENSDFDKEKRKVKFLKNKLKKLEKAHESLGIAFQSQMDQIVSKKDLYISALELKLRSLNDEFGENIRCDVDAFISDKIHLLESQYKQLLEESETQAAQRRQMDLQKIFTLERQLMDNGFGLDETPPVSCKANLMITAAEDPGELALVEHSN